MRATDLLQTAVEMRQAFDGRFAHPLAVESSIQEDFLVVRAAVHSVALRIKEIAGLLRAPELTHLPTEHRALSGLAGVRGTLVAVYDLATLLGDTTQGPDAGFIVLCAADKTVALRFTAVIQYARLEPHALSEERAEDTIRHPRWLARLGDAHLPVVTLSVVLESIRGTPSGVDKE